MILPLPVLPTMAVVLPGSTRPARCRAGPGPGRRGSGTRRRGTRRARPVGGAGRPAPRARRSLASVRSTSLIRPDETTAARDQDEHEHGHHHREQDLHDVLQERDEVADRHLAAVDPDRAEPQDRDRRQVEDGHQQRDHQREQPVDPQRRRGQVVVRDLEALLLVASPHEGPDDPDAAERLARDLVDPVDLDLHGLEQRQGAGHQQADDQRHEPAGRRSGSPTAGRPGGGP